MLKFLRKYQMLLLVVGGSLLMVSFLIGPVLNELASNVFQPIAAEIGDDGEKVPEIDIQRAAFEADILEQFDPFAEFVADPRIGIRLDENNEGEHWYLLTREAEQLGLLGFQSDAESWLRQAALRRLRIQATIEAIREVTTPEQQQVIFSSIVQFQNAATQPIIQSRVIPRLAEEGELAVQALRDARDSFAENNQRVTPEGLDLVFAKAAAVQRMQMLYNAAPALSVQRMKTESENLLGTAVIDFITPRATLFEGDVGEPTEADLQSFFETYRADRPGDLDANRYGIGYTLPNRVKVEWLVIDPLQIRDSLTISRLDARRLWREENPDADPSGFEAAQPVIELRMKRELAEEIAAEADEIFRAAVRRRLSTARSSGPYFDLPEGFELDTLSLESLAQEIVEGIRERRGIDIPAPTVATSGPDFRTAGELSQTLPFASAGFRIGSRTIPAAALADRLRMFMPEDPSLGAQLGVPMFQPPARGDLNDETYFFRVTEARPAGPAFDLAEVETRVRSDWRSVRSFELLEARMDELLALAERDGLGAVGLSFDVVSSLPEETRDIIASQFGLRVFEGFEMRLANQSIGQAAAFRDRVLEASLEIDPTTPDVEQDRFVAVAAPEQRTVQIARVHGRRPLTLELFRRFEPSLQASLPQREIGGFIEERDANPFSYESLVARLKFRSLDEDDSGLFDTPNSRAEDGSSL